MKQQFRTWQTVLPSLFVLTACSQEVPETTAEPAAAAVMARSPSAEGARVYFITPSDGETVPSPVRLEFGLSGMELAPSGDDRPNSGHHHIIIDHELPDLSLPVPADNQRVHFGDARSETELILGPGQHTLQLLFADHLHIPHDPPLFSEQISITVE
jgi:Domain of unknown function (DUF4399)